MENENPKNEYFVKRETKEKETQARETKKKLKGALFRAVVFVIVAAAVWGVWRSFSNRPDIQEVKGDFFPAQSREHVAVGSSHPEYNSNPPTGGWHYGSPAQTGIYDKELPDEQLIHNLEHGHIWIAYRSDLDQETINKLAEIAKSYSSKIIMVPRAKNNVPIALMAWEYLLKLDTFDESQVTGFIKAHRGRGPEDIPDFGFKDFRQK
ncbi:MAG: DUF3105 domain-containing protein [Candidatus Paceibacterota bacterium]